MTRFTPRKNAPFGFSDAAQQHAGERRRQRQRVERGDRHRERDRQRELLIQPAGRAREERDRHEHRRQHQRGRDDGAGHLAHRVGRGLARRLVIVVDVPLDVLDHDDRIVDDEAGRERDAEQRQRVDREAEQLHERERADERDRNRDRRNQRRPPVLEEQEHDEDDQPDRFEQRGDDLADRLGRRPRVVSNASSTFRPGGKCFDSRSSSALTSR